MNSFLTAFIKLWKSFDRGDLPNFPDPDPPADLGDPLTQDEIDWVKSIKKEMEERFDPPPPTCSDEKTGVSITDPVSTNFTIEWTNPAGYTGTSITYRAFGDIVWLVPNAVGNATGTFVGSVKFVFDSGLVPGTSYEILIRNRCANSILSPGVIRVETAT